MSCPLFPPQAALSPSPCRSLKLLCLKFLWTASSTLQCPTSFKGNLATSLLPPHQVRSALPSVLMLSWANALIPFHQLDMSQLWLLSSVASPTQLCTLRIQERRDRGGISLLRKWKLETHWTPHLVKLSVHLCDSPLCAGSRIVECWAFTR